MRLRFHDIDAQQFIPSPRKITKDDCTVDDLGELVATYSPDQFAWALDEDGGLQVFRLREETGDTHVEDHAARPVPLSLAKLNERHTEFYRRKQ